MRASSRNFKMESGLERRSNAGGRFRHRLKRLLGIGIRAGAQAFTPTMP